MGHDKKRLALIAQGITGSRLWMYTDTGGETAATYAGAGYFTNAKDYGVDTGDAVFVKNDASDLVYKGRFTAVQDTGSTQATVTLDTGKGY